MSSEVFQKFRHSSVGSASQNEYVLRRKGCAGSVQIAYPCKQTIFRSSADALSIWQATRPPYSREISEFLIRSF
jgi:hypothetical protein